MEANTRLGSHAASTAGKWPAVPKARPQRIKMKYRKQIPTLPATPTMTLRRPVAAPKGRATKTTTKQVKGWAIRPWNCVRIIAFFPVCISGCSFL